MCDVLSIHCISSGLEICISCYSLSLCIFESLQSSTCTVVVDLTSIFGIFLRNDSVNFDTREKHTVAMTQSILMQERERSTQCSYVHASLVCTIIKLLQWKMELYSITSWWEREARRGSKGQDDMHYYYYYYCIVRRDYELRWVLFGSPIHQKPLRYHLGSQKWQLFI